MNQRGNRGAEEQPGIHRVERAIRGAGVSPRQHHGVQVEDGHDADGQIQDRNRGGGKDGGTPRAAATEDFHQDETIEGSQNGVLERPAEDPAEIGKQRRQQEQTPAWRAEKAKTFGGRDGRDIHKSGDRDSHHRYVQHKTRLPE